MTGNRRLGQRSARNLAAIWLGASTWEWIKREYPNDYSIESFIYIYSISPRLVAHDQASLSDRGSCKIDISTAIICKISYAIDKTHGP